MVIVKATNPNDTNSIWKFSQLDLNLLKMVIKGLWVYDILLDENEMKASLGMVLNHYPHLSGRVEHNGTGITMNKDRKSTRLNSSHVRISYAVFCLKKKKKNKKSYV